MGRCSISASSMFPHSLPAPVGTDTLKGGSQSSGTAGNREDVAVKWEVKDVQLNKEVRKQATVLIGLYKPV